MEVINNNTASAEDPTVATEEAKALSRTPSTIKIFTVKSENNKQTSVLAAELQRDAEPDEDIQAEESREASEATDNTKTATSEEVQNANAILASAVKISSGGTEKPVTEVVVEQRDGIEKVLQEYGVPLPDDACWTAVNEETSKAWTTLNDESAKAWKTVENSKAYNEMSNHLTKFNESASQVYNQTANGLTTAYVMAEEDLSLMGLAITQTQTMKSINELLNSEKTAETNEESAINQETNEEKKEGKEDDDEEVYNQTANGLTTAYVMAEEDLSLMGLAITQTQTMKSINELLNSEKTAETNEESAINQETNEEKKEGKEDDDEDEEEYEGEGMEISLNNRIGDTRKLSEI